MSFLFFAPYVLFACNVEKTVDNTSDSASESISSANVDIPSHQSVELGTTLHFSIGNSWGTQFVWNFGDGNTATVENGGDVDHLYTEAGHFQAVLTATSADGSRASDMTRVTVYPKIIEEYPHVSSAMHITATSIVTVLPEGGIISIIDKNSGALDVYDICPSPKQVAGDDGYLAITCASTAELVIFNTESRSIESRWNLPTNSDPFGVVGSMSAWYITSRARGEIYVLYPGENRMETISVGNDLRGISQLSDGTILAPQFRSSWETGLVYRITPSSTTEGYDISHIEFAIDTAGDSDNTTGGVPNLLENIYPTLDESELFTPFLHSNIMRGLFRNGLPITHQTSLRAMLSTLSIDASQDEPSKRKHFDERGRSSAVAWSSLGDVGYILHPSTAQISVIDRFTLQTVGSIGPLGNMPTDIIRYDNSLFVYVWLDRTVIEYDITDAFRPVEKQSFATITEEPLDAALLRGKQLFHDAQDTRITLTGYIACSSCHPDGDHDGLTWDFTDRGEGLRNTSSLLGRGGTEMGRVHWTGNFDEIQDFENDIRNAFGGSGFLSEEDWQATSAPLGEAKAGKNADLDALALYVSSLGQTPPSPYLPSDTTGESLFADIGCATCHPAPLYTDSTLSAPIRHDVGTITEGSGQRLGQTLDGFDTPTLLGLWATAPYLHDGSASTIDDAIRAHTDYANISIEEVDKLRDFLLSL